MTDFIKNHNWPVNRMLFSAPKRTYTLDMFRRVHLIWLPVPSRCFLPALFVSPPRVVASSDSDSQGSGHRAHHSKRSSTSASIPEAPPVPDLVDQVACTISRGSYLVIYAKSNTMDLGSSYEFVKLLAKRLRVYVLCFEYTGFGFALHKGENITPSEATTQKDMRRVYDFVRDTLKWPAERIILLGDDVGCGVASYGASYAIKERNETVAGVVLRSAFTSVEDIVKARNRPMGSFIFNRFNNVKALSAVKSPLLLLHGEKDEYIPVHLAEKLLASYKGHFLRRIVIAQDRGHHLVELDDILLPIARFLGEIEHSRRLLEVDIPPPFRIRLPDTVRVIPPEFVRATIPESLMQSIREVTAGGLSTVDSFISAFKESTVEEDAIQLVNHQQIQEYLAIRLTKFCRSLAANYYVRSHGLSGRDRRSNSWRDRSYAGNNPVTTPSREGADSFTPHPPLVTRKSDPEAVACLPSSSAAVRTSSTDPSAAVAPPERLTQLKSSGILPMMRKKKGSSSSSASTPTNPTESTPVRRVVQDSSVDENSSVVPELPETELSLVSAPIVDQPKSQMRPNRLSAGTLRKLLRSQDDTSKPPSRPKGRERASTVTDLSGSAGTPPHKPKTVHRRHKSSLTGSPTDHQVTFLSDLGKATSTGTRISFPDSQDDHALSLSPAPSHLGHRRNKSTGGEPLHRPDRSKLSSTLPSAEAPSSPALAPTKPVDPPPKKLGHRRNKSSITGSLTSVFSSITSSPLAPTTPTKEEQVALRANKRVRKEAKSDSSKTTRQKLKDSQVRIERVDQPVQPARVDSPWTPATLALGSSREEAAPVERKDLRTWVEGQYWFYSPLLDTYMEIEQLHVPVGPGPIPSIVGAGLKALGSAPYGLLHTQIRLGGLLYSWDRKSRAAPRETHFKHVYNVKKTRTRIPVVLAPVPTEFFTLLTDWLSDTLVVDQPFNQFHERLEEKLVDIVPHLVKIAIPLYCQTLRLSRAAKKEWELCQKMEVLSKIVLKWDKENYYQPAFSNCQDFFILTCAALQLTIPGESYKEILRAAVNLYPNVENQLTLFKSSPYCKEMHAHVNGIWKGKRVMAPTAYRDVDQFISSHPRGTPIENPDYVIMAAQWYLQTCPQYTEELCQILSRACRGFCKVVKKKSKNAN